MVFAQEWQPRMAGLLLTDVVPKVEKNSPPDNSPDALTDHRFTRQHRLLSSGDFKAVFDNNIVRVGNGEFLLLARPTNHSQSRLGLVVSKKNNKRAVDRNTIKRILRESFRNKRFQEALDIVILTRQGTRNFTRPALVSSVNSIWLRLDKKLAQTRG